MNGVALAESPLNLARESAPSPPDSSSWRLLALGRASWWSGVEGGGSLNQPRGIAAGPDGALYVVEGSQKVVLRIGPDGSARALGTLRTFAAP